ncbi:MAG: hypothetical protein PF517_04940 [Salinivirgaceae bacterium]|jgi:hypothetical protein|nr:hypothetical protein [Salinivirgaceae bacterium]
MSIQKDYLLKMIEMMGDLIAALLGKIKKGDLKIAEEQLEQYYGDFLKKDAAFFRQLPLDGITDRLLNEHNFTNDHLKILAELFFIEGELHIAKKNIEDGKINFNKALKILVYLDKELKTFDLQQQQKIELIMAKIKDFE